VEFLIKSHKPALDRNIQLPGFSYSILLRSGLPFFLFDLVGNIALNMDIFLIKYEAGDFYLGNYAFYKKLSLAPFMAIAIVGNVLQTKYIELQKNENQENLQSFIFKTNRYIFLASFLAVCMMLLAYVFFSKYNYYVKTKLFDLYEGYEYMLYILCLGELIFSAFGPNNYFMVMMGFEKKFVQFDLMFCGFVVVFGFVFKKVIGYDAFLYAYLVGRVLKNGLIWGYIKRKTGISFFVF
jgi:O-antigen/teichoic acid export membrane protein